MNTFKKEDIDELDKLISEKIDKIRDEIININNNEEELIESGVNTNELIKKYDSKLSTLYNLLIKIRN
jgi:hypothetical protein